MITSSGADLTRIDFGSESQGAERFVEIIESRIYIDEHESFAVAPEGVLQEVSQFGVAIRDVGILVGEGGDDIPEAR